MLAFEISDQKFVLWLNSSDSCGDPPMSGWDVYGVVIVIFFF